MVPTLMVMILPVIIMLMLSNLRARFRIVSGIKLLQVTSSQCNTTFKSDRQEVYYCQSVGKTHWSEAHFYLSFVLISKSFFFGVIKFLCPISSSREPRSRAVPIILIALNTNMVFILRDDPNKTTEALVAMR